MASDEPWAATAFVSRSHDDPPFDDVPPPFDDDVPPEIDAPADERVPSYEASAVQRTPGGQNAGTQNPDQNPAQKNPAEQNPAEQNPGHQSAPAPRQHPNASGQRGSMQDPSRAPSFAEKQRYGEAVVREILGATFIEEQPYSAAPRTRNDH